jgi:transposase-like protein
MQCPQQALHNDTRHSLILPAEQQATMLAEKRMDETYIKIQGQ